MRAVLVTSVAICVSACGGRQALEPGDDAAAVDGPAAVDGAAGAPAVDVNAVLRGAGCGKPLPADQPPTVPSTPKGYKQFTVMGAGATLAGQVPAKVGPRTFWVRVP